jgi:hypothetical protein
MSDLKTVIVSGVIGAVAGGVSGAIMGWLIAPTRAEREERGRQRLQARRQIAVAIANLSYELIETRGRLFRMEDASDLLNRSKFLEFAGAVKSAVSSLPRLERWRVTRAARTLIGQFIWRLAEIVPREHYEGVDEASLLKVTADTRASADASLCNAVLLGVRPTDAKWDAALKAVEKMQRTYPG